MSSYVGETKTRNTFRRKRVLLGITGSVAAIKGPELALVLSKELDAHVVVLLTNGGSNFWYKAQSYNPHIWKEYQEHQILSEPGVADCKAKHGGDLDQQQMSEHGSLSPKLPNDDTMDRSIILLTAQDEWKGWKRIGDPVLHIQLRDWADIAVIAPLSAHTLAKISNGLCDDTLTCVLRAWDFGYKNNNSTTTSSACIARACPASDNYGKPVVLAPAMNTAMWEHPLTQSQLNIIANFGKGHGSESLVKIVHPQVKTLACGEIGNGALAPTAAITKAAKDSLVTYQGKL